MQAITLLVQTEGSELNHILAIGGLMVSTAFGSLLLSVIVAVLVANVSSNFGAILREKLFNKVLSLSKEDMSDFSNASLMTRSTNDVTQIQTFLVIGLQMIIKLPVMAVWALAKISNKAWAWTAATGVATVVLFSIIGVCMYLAIPKFKLRQEYTDDLNRVTREHLTGIDVIRAYNADNYQKEKFKVTNENLTATNLFTNRVMAVMHPSITIIMNGLTLAIYWIGAVLIQNAQAGEHLVLFSDMIVFSTYAMQVIMSLMMLVMVFAIMPAAQVSGKRISKVLETESTILDGSETEGKAGKRGEVEFKNVTFRYPNAEENILEDISFKVSQGETVAIIGSTASGKSTLINLIPRFYDVTSGEVLVDGINVKDYSLYALNNKIGYATQQAILFSGDVTSNIAYGDNGKTEPSERDVKKAAEVAQASEFITRLGDSYDAHVAQGGANFSGGQKQRLSIARALARKPEILIFDDSFSALDYQTDRKLRQALYDDFKETTKIIVAQRVATIKEADQIIVLEAGRIAGIGTHEELLATSDIYQEIAYSQLSKEELA